MAETLGLGQSPGLRGAEEGCGEWGWLATRLTRGSRGMDDVQCPCPAGRAKKQLKGKTEAVFLVGGSWLGLQPHGEGKLAF